MGFVTEAARNGASERAIAKQTGHRSVAVLRGYIEDATVFEDRRAARPAGERKVGATLTADTDAAHLASLPQLTLN